VPVVEVVGLPMSGCKTETQWFNDLLASVDARCLARVNANPKDYEPPVYGERLPSLAKRDAAAAAACNTEPARLARAARAEAQRLHFADTFAFLRSVHLQQYISIAVINQWSDLSALKMPAVKRLIIDAEHRQIIQDERDRRVKERMRAEAAATRKRQRGAGDAPAGEPAGEPAAKKLKGGEEDNLDADEEEDDEDEHPVIAPHLPPLPVAAAPHAPAPVAVAAEDATARVRAFVRTTLFADAGKVQIVVGTWGSNAVRTTLKTKDMLIVSKVSFSSEYEKWEAATYPATASVGKPIVTTLVEAMGGVEKNYNVTGGKNRIKCWGLDVATFEAAFVPQ